MTPVRVWLNKEIAEVRAAMKKNKGPHLYELNDMLKIIDELLTACEANPKNVDCAFAIVNCAKIIHRQETKE